MEGDKGQELDSYGLKRRQRAETEMVEQRPGETESERQSNILNEAIERAIYQRQDNQKFMGH